MLPYFILTLFTAQVFMVSIYDDTIPLPDLDARIIKEMLNPQPDKGDDLWKNAYNYFNLLDDIRILLKKPWKRHIALKKYVEVQDLGGPKFVNTTFDYDAFRTAFMWTIEDFTEFKGIQKATKKLWHELGQMVTDIENKTFKDDAETK